MIYSGKNYTSGRNLCAKEGLIRFGDTQSASPFTAATDWGLWVNTSNKGLYFWNGTSDTMLSAGGGGSDTWESLYARDASFALTTATWTITQSGAASILTLTKTNTSTGVPLVINNAGTSDDVQIVNTDGGATGAVISTDHQSASPADNDVILTLEVNAFDDGGGATEFANIKFVATDVSAATEDCAITMNEMIAGTSRKVFSLTGPDLVIGYGAAATISSQGAYDLVLKTNEGTNSGTITITDGLAGAIALAPDTTGIVTISTGLQTGGTTPTACIFNAAGTGGGGTTGSAVDINVTTLTTGTALEVDSASSASGLLLDLQLAHSSVFSVSETGATVIAGSAGTDILTITTGDVLLSDSSITMTDADNASSLTIINNSCAASNLVDLNGDGVTSGYVLHIDSNNGASFTTGGYFEIYDGAASCFTVKRYGATTITTGAAATSLILASASTSSDVMQIATTALTTGDALQITSTAETLAAGELLKIDNTENGDISATPKTGNLCSISSSVTATTNSASLDYDTLLISRTDIVNQGTKTLTSAGSVLKLMRTLTATAGTTTDTANILEILQVDGGSGAPTGTCVSITGVGVASRAIDVVSAATSVSDVRITASGVKASTKAALEVVASGATAAGGAVLRVAATGTPAAATSYMAVITGAGATMTNNPVGVYINNKDSTAAALQVTGSGAMAAGLVELNSTATGALGAVLALDQTANSAAAGDVIGRLLFTAQDDANAAETYGRIDCVIRDTAAANPDASLVFYVDKAGTNTQHLAIGWDTVNAATLAGILIGTGAATAIVSSQGAYDLTLETNGGTNSGTITITDAANGNITVTPNGTGMTQVFGLSYGQVTAGADGAASLTPAMCGLYTIGNTIGRTLTLPAMSAAIKGLWYTIKKTSADAAAVTIDTPGAETIDGAATNAEVDAQYDSITIVSDGANWHVVSKKIAA